MTHFYCRSIFKKENWKQKVFEEKLIDVLHPDMKNMNMKSPVFTNMGQNMAKGWNNVVDSAKKGVDYKRRDWTDCSLFWHNIDNAKYDTFCMNSPIL